MIIVVVLDGRGFDDQAIETTFVQVQAHHRVVRFVGFVVYGCYDELEVRLLRLLWLLSFSHRLGQCATKPVICNRGIFGLLPTTYRRIITTRKILHVK